MDPLSTARYGMMTAENQLAASASRVVQMNDPSQNVDLAQEMVNQLEAKQQFTASAQVVRVSNEMWRALMEAQKA